MKKNILRAGIFLVFSLNIVAREMSLTEVLRTAKKQNFSIRASHYGTESKKRAKDRYYKNMILPKIDLSLSGEIRDSNWIGPREIATTIPVYTGGRVTNDYKKAKNSYEMSKKEETLIETEVEETVVATYFGLLTQQRNVQYTRESLNSLEKQRQRMKILYENGKLIPKSDVLKIEADIEKNYLELTQAKYAEEDLRQKLYLLMGMPIDSKITFSQQIDERSLITGKYNNLDIKTMEEKVSRESTRAKLNEMELKNSEYTYNISKSKLYPNIYLSPGYTFSVNGDNDDDEGFRVTLGVNWTFEWGGTMESVAESKFSHEEAKVQYAKKTEELILLTRSSYRRIESLKKQLEIEDKRMTILENNYKIDTNRYDNGLMSTVDYLKSVSEVKKSQETYYALQRELTLATLEYENLFK